MLLRWWIGRRSLGILGINDLGEWRNGRRWGLKIPSGNTGCGFESRLAHFFTGPTGPSRLNLVRSTPDAVRNRTNRSRTSPRKRRSATEGAPLSRSSGQTGENRSGKGAYSFESGSSSEYDGGLRSNKVGNPDLTRWVNLCNVSDCAALIDTVPS